MVRRPWHNKAGDVRIPGHNIENAFQQFAAVEGSDVYDGFKTGASVYLRYFLQKA
jgi:hypothetical protein